MLIETHKQRKNHTLSEKDTPFRAEALIPDYRAKPWGRHDGIPGPESALPLGEMIFDAREAGLVVKWIQTAGPLSVQLHPQRGRGRKHEWWYVADVRPGAWLYLGLKKSASRDEIRKAALSGRLPDMLRRIEPAVGDMFFVEAGTLHALGPGLTVVEVQEPSDTTFRLFDYGRPRELHLEQALDEAILDPQPISLVPGEAAPFRIACEMVGPEQRVVLTDEKACAIPVIGSGTFGNADFGPRQCWQFYGPLVVRATEPTVLIVAESCMPRTDSENLWRARQ